MVAASGGRIRQSRHPRPEPLRRDAPLLQRGTRRGRGDAFRHGFVPAGIARRARGTARRAVRPRRPSGRARHRHPAAARQAVPAALRGRRAGRGGVERAGARRRGAPPFVRGRIPENTEAVNLFLNYIKNNTNLKQIIGIALAANRASRRVLEKCEFELIYEGTGLYQGRKRKIIKTIKHL